MASGLVMCRINRPNIWLHRPAKITKNTLAKTEPSTYGPRLKGSVWACHDCCWGLTGRAMLNASLTVHDAVDDARFRHLSAIG